jgi:hypothetical protein
MTKSEIIEITLRALHQDQGLLAAEEPGCDSLEDYEDVVIATLEERLPEGNIQMCEDFKGLNVKCCQTCHSFYPHFEMSVVDLSDGGKAWLCCSVHSALLPKSQVRCDSTELAAVDPLFGSKPLKE